MFDAIIGFFTSFNPVIAGVMVSTGAYIVLRRRAMAPPRTRSVRTGPAARRDRRARASYTAR